MAYNNNPITNYNYFNHKFCVYLRYYQRLPRTKPIV